MKVDGSSGAGAAQSSGMSEESAIRQQIQALTKQLNQIEQKQRPTKQDAVRKKALKKRIAALKKRLAQIRARKINEQNAKLKAAEAAGNADGTGSAGAAASLEPGVGENLDTYV